MGRQASPDSRLIHQKAVGDLSSLPAFGQLLGLDVSKNHIGVAIAEWGQTDLPALPIVNIKRSGFAHDMDRLKNLIEERNIGGVIFGLPIQMDGKEGSRAQSVRDFAKAFLALIPLPFAFWDERLSTKQALRKIGKSKKGKNMTDAISACLILDASKARLKETSLKESEPQPDGSQKRLA